MTAIPDPDAVVIGDLNLLRPVAAAGLRSIVICFDSRTRHSRYCRASFELSSPVVDMERSVRELCDLGSSLQTRPVLYYSNDAQLLMVSRHREELGRYFRFLMPAPELIEGMVDKAHFHDLAVQHQFPTPRSLLCRAHDTAAIESPWGFPCVVKPVTRVGWYEAKLTGNVPHKVLKADTQHELTRAVSVMRARRLDFMLQEFVGGGDDQICSFHAYFDRSSEPLAWFVGRKVRTYPLDTGKSTCLQLAVEPEVANVAITCLRSIGFQGVVKVDFKKDPRTGRLYLLEINPRFNIWHYLGAVSGVNLPQVAHQYLQGSWTGVRPTYRVGRFWISQQLDLLSTLSAVRQGRLQLGKWLRSYLGPKVYNTFAWTDPAPAFFVAVSFPARYLRRRRPVPRSGKPSLSPE